MVVSFGLFVTGIVGLIAPLYWSPNKTKTKFEYMCSEPNGNNDAAGFPHSTLAAVYKPTYKRGLSTWQTMAGGGFVSKCHKNLAFQLWTQDCGCPQTAPQLLWISLPHVWLWRRLLHVFDCSGDLCGFYQLDVATPNGWDQVQPRFDCSLCEASVAVSACVNKNLLNQGFFTIFPLKRLLEWLDLGF